MNTSDSEVHNDITLQILSSCYHRYGWFIWPGKYSQANKFNTCRCLITLQPSRVLDMERLVLSVARERCDISAYSLR